MTTSVLSQNLVRFRTALGLSQVAVAEKAGLSRQAYRALEAGETEPRSSTLLAVAGALGVAVPELLVPVRSLQTVRFRASKKMTTRGQVLADVARWLDDYNELEELVGDRVKYRLKALPSGRRSPARVKEFAGEARKQLGLAPDAPIRDICGLLEDHGVKVYRPEVLSEGFFGLSVAGNDGGPAIVVNTWERVSVERWIFSAAHELGHLLLHLGAYDVSRDDEVEQEEREADLFASHFLMPDEVFRHEWEQARGLALVDRVFKLKHIFHVSYKTVLYRVQEVTGDKAIWGKFFGAYKALYATVPDRKGEPLPLSEADFQSPEPVPKGAQEPRRLGQSVFVEDRLQRLVRDAVDGEQLSLSRAAEILRLDLRTMRSVANSWVS